MKGAFKEKGVRFWTGLNWLTLQSSNGCCEHGNEISGSINGG